jgi:hypothetical protein
MSFFIIILLALVLFTWFTWYVRSNFALWFATIMCWAMVLSTAKAELWALVAQE